MERIEIRWHGRGGQGTVTASVVTAEAAVYQGKYAQAYPEFGAERRGAPVRAYTRISITPIYTRSPILNPDVVVVLDPSLNKSLYLDGIKSGGIVIVNTKKNLNDLKIYIDRKDLKIARVDATQIALDILKSPFVNMAMIGALIKIVPVVDIHYVEEVIKESFKPKIAEANIEAVRRAYKEVETL